jgi:hypothetical protein
MSKGPEWLPPIVSVNGIWEEVLSRLYRIFESDFKQGKPRFGYMPVWWETRILVGEKYEEGFWHLISKDDKKTKERLFDPRRAERLPWCSPTIKNKDDQVAKVWEYREAKGRIRTYLWLESFDYVVILEKRKQKIGMVAFLITAFYVDGESRKRSLTSKYSKRII